MGVGHFGQGNRLPKSTVFHCVLSSWLPVITSGTRPGLHQSALPAGNYHCSGGGHGLQVTCLLDSGEAGLESRAIYLVGQMCLGAGPGVGEENGLRIKQLRSGKVGCLVCLLLQGLGKPIGRHHLGKPQSLP